MRPIHHSVCLCLFLVNIFFTGYSYSQSESEIVSRLSANPVTIDGRWTSQDEWIDAAEISYGDAVFCIKDDKSFLYVLLDFISDETVDLGDLAGVRFDVLSDKANKPQPDDYSVSLIHQYSGVETIWIFQGNGTQWTLNWRGEWNVENPLRIVAASTGDAANDPYSKSPHVVYEFAIPRNMFGDKSAIGFSAYMAHRELNETSLPQKADYHPSTWAKLSFAFQLGTVTPPEVTPSQTQTPSVPEETLKPPASPATATSKTATGQWILPTALIGITAAVVVGALAFHRRTAPRKKKVRS